MSWINFSLGKQPIPQEQYRQIQIIDHLIPLRGYQNISLGGIVRPQTGPGFLMLQFQLWQSLDTLTVKAVFSELHFKGIFSRGIDCLATPEEACSQNNKTLFSDLVLVLVYASNTLGLRLPDLSLKEE